MATTSDRPRVFAVSKVRLDDDGRITHIYWGEVDTEKNDWTGPERVSPVIDAVYAIHDGGQVFALFPSTHGHLPERQFRVVDYENGLETISLEGLATHEREVHDMEPLEI